MRDDDDRIFRDTFLEERSEERAHALLVTVTILLVVAVVAIAIMFGFFFMRRSADSGGTVVGTIADKNGDIVIIQSSGETSSQPETSSVQETDAQTQATEAAAESEMETQTETKARKTRKKKKNKETQAAAETQPASVSAFTTADPAKIEEIMTQYSQAQDWAVCIWDLAGDKQVLAGDAREKMFTSATISVPILYTAAVMLDAGEISMDSPIVYENSIGGRGEWDPSKRQGQTYPLSFYLQTMLTYSDNNCMNCLIDFLTLESINSICHEAGFESVDLQRKIVAEVTDGSENYVSAADLAGMVKDLYSNTFKEIDRNFMTQFFHVDESDANRTLIGLSSSLGAQDVFLNQNGRGDTRYSEAAVIVRGESALIVSVMLRGEYGFAYDEAVIKTADYILEKAQ